MFDIHIVTHAYAKTVRAYATHALIQGASLYHYCPKDIKVKWTVYSTKDDDQLWHPLSIQKERLPDNVTADFKTLKRECLFRRAYGRNLSALENDANIYMFTDADYAFGEGCLSSVMEHANRETGFFFPKELWINKTHEDGDELVDLVEDEEDLFPELKSSEFGFVNQRQKRLIGGAHWIGARWLQEMNRKTEDVYGYLNKTSWSKPLRDISDGFKSCRCDPRFKHLMIRSFEWNPVQFDIPNIFRIRHSVAGRCLDDDGNRIVEKKEGWTHD